VRITARRVLRGLGYLAAALVLAAAGAWYVSADVRYLVRAGVEEAGILLRRRPITAVVADPATDARTRGKLELVLAARAFAADSLGLAAGESFTTFSPLHRDTLVLVLSASRYDRLAEKLWTYPVVGSVPYKGFFSFDAALDAARALERDGMDTYLRVSDAFSTLGWFNDPVLSTALQTDSVDLAATVIHELLHNTLFVPGQVPFDESLAEFVGYHGAERFFQSRGEPRLAAAAAARWRDEVRLSHFWQGLYDQLEQLYAPGIAGAPLREERQRVFRLAGAELAGPVGHSLETIDGARLAEEPINNAVVIAQRFYLTNLDSFDRLYRADHQDLRTFVRDLVQRTRGSADPWSVLK